MKIKSILLTGDDGQNFLLLQIMKKITAKIKKIILNPSQKELIFFGVAAAILLVLFIFLLVKLNQPKKEIKGVETKKQTKISHRPKKKMSPFPTIKTTKTPTPTIKRYATLIPTTYNSPTSAPTSTPTPAPSSTMTLTPTNTSQATNTPTMTPSATPTSETTATPSQPI